MTVRIAAVVALAGLSVGCAGIAVQKNQMQSVKSVAVVGFSSKVALADKSEEAKSGSVFGAVNQIKSASDVLSGEYDTRRVALGKALYQEVGTRLEREFGWKVLPPEQLQSQTAYKAWLEKWPNEGMMAMGTPRHPQVLREEAAVQLSAAERKALLASLGVDALAFVRVDYEIGDKGGVSVGGFGKRTIFPRAVVRMRVYGADGEKPIWEDRYAAGDTQKEGFAIVNGMTSNERETEILTAAAQSGLDKALERYKAAK